MPRVYCASLCRLVVAWDHAGNGNTRDTQVMHITFLGSVRPFSQSAVRADTLQSSTDFMQLSLHDCGFRHVTFAERSEKYGFLRHSCNVLEPPPSCNAGGSLLEAAVRVPASRTVAALRNLDVYVAWAPASEPPLVEIRVISTLSFRVPKLVAKCTAAWEMIPLPPVDLQSVAECVSGDFSIYFGRPARGVLVAAAPVSYGCPHGHFWLADSAQYPDAFGQGQNAIFNGPKIFVSISLPASLHSI